MMRLRPVLFCLFLLGAGCDDGAPEHTDEAAATGSDSLVAPARDGRPTATFPRVDKTCSAQQNAGKKLLADHQACTVDADCVVELVRAPCVDAFLCPVAVARDTDMKKLRSEAEVFSTSYKKRCGDTCRVAKCAGPDSQHVFCNRETKRCDATLQPVDAGATLEDAGTAQVDAGPPTSDAGDPRFACTEDKDCTQKNVGNLCGDYPRCANVGAKFDPPELDSVVCGWPSIEACACRSNKCVSLQRGHEN